MTFKRLALFLVAVTFLQAQIPTQYVRDTARTSAPWVTDGIIYEIYPRSFSPEGTFAGIERKLPELKQLGVTILWLMPIHPVGVKERKGSLGSPYSVRDYYGINPEFGTLDDFKRLVAAAHREGFRIIIDLVANHTSWDSRLFTEHPEWFVKDSTGAFQPPVPDWSDVVKLDYRKPGLRRAMIDMMKYWVRDIGIDGYRCDVAEMVPVDFWDEARAALDSIRSVVMLAEGQYAEFHLKAFDLTYSWNYYKTLSAVIAREQPAQEMDSVLTREARSYPKGSLRLRFSSNHDENAWDNPDVVKYGPAGARLAVVLTAVFPGVPLLYNGQEVGNDRKLGLFEKIGIDWSTGMEWRKLYTSLFRLRKENIALTHGRYTPVRTDSARSVYAFLRTAGRNTVFAVFNFAASPRRAGLTLPASQAGRRYTDAFTGKRVTPEAIRSLVLPAQGYAVFTVH